MSTLSFNAQNKAEFMIRFSDKNGSPYSIANPSAFLSARSINRRAKQNIPIKEDDLPVNQSYIDSIIKTGVKLLNRSKWLNAVSIDTTGFPTALSKIISYPFVIGIKPLGIKPISLPDAQRSKTEGRNKNKFGTLTTISTSPAYNYGGSLNQASMIGADCLHSLGYRGEGMVIAIIDAGFYKADSLQAFDSLRTNGQLLGTFDFANHGNNIYNEMSHGMMVLSTMGGNLPGQLIGTAPKAKYWLLRSEVAATENIIEEFNWASAAEFADSVGADVINSSLGYLTFDDPSQNQTYADMNGKVALSSIAATVAARKGMVVVVSAGNSGPGTIGSPADADSILAIGAVDENGALAGFSSHGPSYDKRVKPNTMAQGQHSVVASAGGGITLANGTSFASPITAGAVTCLWQANPNKTNMQILDAVQKSAGQYTNPDSLMGYGIPNMCVANMVLGGQDFSSFQNDLVLATYPNPFDNIIHLTFYSSQVQSITFCMFDMCGRLVSENNMRVNTNSLNYFTINDIEQLAKGMYVLRVSSTYNNFYYKLIKN
ncbi:MAG: S8 family serine peptidase [Bacteroidia bacterium]|nr:S8 family serine peptidase [Bacteroidia bacterium]